MLTTTSQPREAPMKMREYVDRIQGEGTWDRMHDLIAKQEIFGPAGENDV
jgi:hypothetical protein